MTDAVQHHCTRPWWLRPPVWLIGIALVALAVYAIVEVTGKPAFISYSAFLDQLDAGNIASVTFKGTEIDGRLKHPSNNAAANGAASADTFRSRVPDFGDPALMMELHSQHVAIDVTSSSSWTRLLLGIPLPMWFFLIVIAVAGIVRLVRGGKAQSGTTIPMHPMQGMIGLVSGLFAKQKETPNEPTHEDNEPKSR